MVETMRLAKYSRWLTLLIWSLIALTYLAFFLTDLWLDIDQLQTPCTGAACNFLAVSQAEAAVLESWGWSMGTYSLLLNGFTILCVAVCVSLGGLIQWRQGHSRIGWSVSLALIVIPITMISGSKDQVGSIPDLFILSMVLSAAGVLIMLLFFYLFPNGNFYPPQAPVVLVFSFLAFTVFVLEDYGLVFFPDWASQIVQIVLNGFILLACVFQILRYQKVSTPVERQQTKWIVLGLGMLILSFPIWFLVFGGGVEFSPGKPRLLASIGAWISIMLMISSLPVTIAIAIQRHRLWDVDLVIRRTLQYALLSGLLSLVYFGGVALLQSLLSVVDGQSSSPVAIVLTTLLIAALFNPLRRRLQDFIDRRFYRQKYDAEKALAEFSAEARSETDLEQLSDHLVSTVQETLQPEVVNLWLRQR